MGITLERRGAPSVQNIKRAHILPSLGSAVPSGLGEPGCLAARGCCTLDMSGSAAGSPAQVARGSRDVSSPQEPCFPLRNMISKSQKEEPCLQGEAERKVSKLFGNYSRDQPIFLQLKDYFWVKAPSAYELPYGTKGSEDLLLRVLAITSYSIPESIQSLKCCRCVVVGNGHRLRNSSLGDVINKYDMVIRLNNAPVAGYEGDVGSKTTMRLFYPESAHFNPKVENNPDTLLVLVAFKAMDFHWIETILSDKKRVRKGFWKQPPLIWDVNPKQIRILNPFFMEIAADKLLSLPMQQPRKMKQKPTTGLVAITLALHLCDVVHIAGFGYPDAHNRKQTIHYYEQITLKSMAGSGHNVSQEALAIKRMLGMGAVRNLTYF
ncbi:CMP-N-acetylneuraminate-beta-galactosamide-alpha-2,3-sialyltransferase 4 isoform 9-T9 [Molossus nigricans]